MAPLILPLPGSEAMATAIGARSGAEVGALECRRFPDGESYVRVVSNVDERDVDVLCTLADPDTKFLNLCFVADAARGAGARRVRLIAPYLSYLRQDARFKAGEALAASQFASLLSGVFDALITVDPHLHRLASLSDVYSIPTSALTASDELGAWIGLHVDEPLIVGPDEESLQWASRIAAAANAPCITLMKTRLGDRHVRLEAADDIRRFIGRQPVLVDDIASSGATLSDAARLLRVAGFAKPHCAVVHAIFADGALERIRAESGFVISTDTIRHETNVISVAGLLAKEMGKPFV
jgi:ribose-phosphate pyrophosphokinase